MFDSMSGAGGEPTPDLPAPGAGVDPADASGAAAGTAGAAASPADATTRTGAGPAAGPTAADPAGADPGADPVGGVSLVTADVVAFTAALATMTPAGTEVDNVDRIRALERLKAVCAAAQARESAALADTRRHAETAAGVPAQRRGRGLGAEIALARGDSPTRGGRHLGLAHALVHEMPHTMAALTTGQISEWRATLLARETAWLPTEGRRHVDAALAQVLTGLGDRALAGRARALAQAFDPAAAVAHLRQSETRRRVWTRPAPEAMVYLTALLPMVQGVAAYAALDKSAQTTTATGQANGRTRGQIMADTLLTRLTGQETPDAVPVEIHLVMTDTTLLGTTGTTGTTTTTGATSSTGNGDDGTNGATTETTGATGATGATSAGSTTACASSTAGAGALGDDRIVLDPTGTSAWLVGHGPIPAPAARDLLHPDHDPTTKDRRKARIWLRRLYTDPATGHLVAMDTRRRRFPAHLRRLLILRDDTCRTPWCDAPIRHADHATPHHTGGPTTYTNGSGLCEHCNQTKEADAWHHHATPDHLDITTPTGHTYTTPTQPMPGTNTNRNRNR